MWCKGNCHFCGSFLATFFSGFEWSKHKFDNSQNDIDKDIVHKSISINLHFVYNSISNTTKMQKKNSISRYKSIEFEGN